MAQEIIVINDIQVPCQIVQILGDDTCLFYSLSYLCIMMSQWLPKFRLTLCIMFLTTGRGSSPSLRIGQRILIVLNISTSSKCLGLTTMELFVNSRQQEIYSLMSCKVFQGSVLLATFGDALQGVKRIRFIDFNEGHFHVLIQLSESIYAHNVTMTNPDNDHQSSITGQPMECELNLSCIMAKTHFTPYTC